MLPDLLPAAFAAHPLQARLLAARRARATRRVPLATVTGLRAERYCTARPGDLLLARIAQAPEGAWLQSADGRQRSLRAGDEVIVSAATPPDGDSSAPIPLETRQRWQLLGSGGAAGAASFDAHEDEGAITTLVPLGVLLDAHARPVSIARHALAAVTTTIDARRAPTVIASLGPSAGCGKTTTAAHLITGLTRAGLSVGAATITGDGSGRDAARLREAGAAIVLDEVDAGHACTRHLPLAALLRIAARLHAHLAAANCEVVVFDLADGMYSGETSALLAAPAFAQAVDGVLFSTADAAEAALAAPWIARSGYRLLGFCGAVGAARAAREHLAAATGRPVYGAGELAAPVRAEALLRQAQLLPAGATYLPMQNFAKI